MRPTTERRYACIRMAASELYGRMPAMKMYVTLGERFNLSDEHIRRILRKKPP